MQTTQPVKRLRPGRPIGSGRYGEPTVTKRVPVSVVKKVKLLIEMHGRCLPLIVVGKPSEKRGR